MTRTVRRAALGDVSAITAVHLASRDDAYAPLAGAWPTPDRDARGAIWVESLSRSDGRPLVLVSELDGAIVGFVSGGSAERTEPDAEFEIYVIHVHPDHRGNGVGSDLWDAACQELRGPGLASVYVDTLAELRCCSFYERRGGLVVERRPMDFHGAMQTHLTYRWARGVPCVRPGI